MAQFTALENVALMVFLIATIFVSLLLGFSVKYASVLSNVTPCFPQPKDTDVNLRAQWWTRSLFPLDYPRCVSQNSKSNARKQAQLTPASSENRFLRFTQLVLSICFGCELSLVFHTSMVVL